METISGNFCLLAKPVLYRTLTRALSSLKGTRFSPALGAALSLLGLSWMVQKNVWCAHIPCLWMLIRSNCCQMACVITTTELFLHPSVQSWAWTLFPAGTGSHTVSSQPSDRSVRWGHASILESDAVAFLHGVSFVVQKNVPSANHIFWRPIFQYALLCTDLSNQKCVFFALLPFHFARMTNVDCNKEAKSGRIADGLQGHELSKGAVWIAFCYSHLHTRLVCVCVFVQGEDQLVRWWWE